MNLLMTSFVEYQSLPRLVSTGPFTPVLSQAVLTTGGARNDQPGQRYLTAVSS